MIGAGLCVWDFGLFGCGAGVVVGLLSCIFSELVVGWGLLACDCGFLGCVIEVIVGRTSLYFGGVILVVFSCIFSCLLLC